MLPIHGRLLHNLIRIFAILLLLQLEISTYGQIKSIGTPNITHYSREDYNASTQNWDILQDKRGILYFANNDGLLEFDGINWRRIPIPNGSVARSIATDEEGTIYVGAYNDFGYLEASPTGKLTFKSLTQLVPEEIQNFGDIWKIHVTPEGVIFQSFSEIFLYKNNSIRTIAQKRDFHFSFYCQGHLYITERNKGLQKLVDEKLIPVEGGNVFDNNIAAMLPLDNGRILIGTSNDGLFVLENNRVKRWQVEVNAYLQQNQIYTAAEVKDHIALGTILDGLLIINKQGNPVQHINRDKGLQNNTILSLYTDNYENLWLGLDNGIDYVQTNSPFTNIVNENIIGAGYVSALYNGKIYLGTNQGLFYKEWSSLANPLEHNHEFKIVENSQGQVWDLYVHEGQLFCGHNNGTYLIEENKAKLISEIKGGWLLLTFPDQQNLMLQGTYTGLVRYEQVDNSTWLASEIPGFRESCRNMEPYLNKDHYTLWMSHGYKGIFRIKMNRALDSILNIDFYKGENGLSTDYGNQVLRFYDEIIFTNNTGIYQFNKQEQVFAPANELMTLFGDKGPLKKITADKEGNQWFIQGDELGMVQRMRDGNYKISRTQFKAFAGTFVTSFEHLLPYRENNVIIATETGFAHFNNSFRKDTEVPFKTHIRSVKTTNDSLLFDGAFVDASGHITDNNAQQPELALPYKYNDIKFAYASTHYENNSNTRYQFILEGFEDQWSDWTKATSKEYTNIPEGAYTFRIKALNIFGVESQEAAFHFEITPPWYRSVYSYLGYFVLGSLLVWIAVFFIRKRIDNEKKQLQEKQQKALKQQKINHENEVLSAQQEIVRLRNEKLRIENEKSKAEVEVKTKELAGYAMQITQKNEILNGIKEQLKHIAQSVNPDSQIYLHKLVRNIESSTNPSEDWEKFEGYFDQVYHDFTKRLREKYPNLTPNDVKLCAYLRMNLSTKEIAPLLNISIRGVEIHRYRLRKKIGLSKNDNLIEVMMNI